MGRFHPSVVLTEPPGLSRTEVSLCCDASWLVCRKLSGTYRPVIARAIKAVMAFTADVAPHHRFVPEECVCSCKVHPDVSGVTAGLLQVKFYRSDNWFNRYWWYTLGVQKCPARVLFPCKSVFTQAALFLFHFMRLSLFPQGCKTTLFWPKRVFIRPFIRLLLSTINSVDENSHMSAWA